MRGKKLALNSITSILLQLITVICGFILPRMILKTFGSDVNGLVVSISQFLSIISFLELGVGAVVRSALYKALAEKNSSELNRIMTSANKFFSKIGVILFVYVVILVILFPCLSESNFNFVFTSTLIIAISISFFAQYFVGIVDTMLLIADQLGYVYNIASVISLIFNTVLCVFFLENGYSIHIVKLVSSLVFLVRPIILRVYINKKYNINRHVNYEHEPISQKWNGIGQHVSAVVLNNTDTVVLTVFSTLGNVSIYAVYNMVVTGIAQLFLSVTNGIEALLAEMWYKREKENVNNFFFYVEWGIHTTVTLFFGCVATVLVDFVRVYTTGVSDVNYIQPFFSLLIVIAQTLYCYRLPYHIMIKSVGHYKETQRCYFISAIINLLLSVVLVKFWGLVGVAIGTIVGMSYQTIWMERYCSKFIIKRSKYFFIKQMLIDIASFLLGYLWISTIRMNEYNYLNWFLVSCIKMILWFIIVVILNLMMNKKHMLRIFVNCLKH